VSDIPVALVTGTNGKTTTVRMLAAIARAAGLTAGNTSTDGVQLGGAMILEGDYTGGEGARALLRDQRVDVAFLEVARGGMLRRGLPVEDANVAYVANIGTDHLGEYGIDTLARLAEVKLMVAKAVDESGVLVANGDDEHLTTAFERPGTVAVRLDPEELDDRPAFVRQRGRLGPVTDGRVAPWIEQADVPALLGGAAVHNVYNALGAMAVATGLGISRAAVVDGLSSFASDPSTNPGRCNLFNLGGVRAIVDYAHNPEGLELILRMLAGLGGTRTLIVIGQAGDRDDESVDALADVCAAHAPDRVIVKTMQKYGRGRDAAEIAARLRDRLSAQGVSPDDLDSAPDEMSAVKAALEWCRDGDILLLLSHAARTDVLDLLSQLSATDWHPGSPLPSSG
jgi:UDP-N-acetylmuramyl tripeptide synthase